MPVPPQPLRTRGRREICRFGEAGIRAAPPAVPFVDERGLLG